eukprot:gene6456-3088_t
MASAASVKHDDAYAKPLRGACMTSDSSSATVYNDMGLEACKAVCDGNSTCSAIHHKRSDKTCSIYTGAVDMAGKRPRSRSVCYTKTCAGKRSRSRSGCYAKSCVPSTLQLSDFEVWQKEQGYWLGEYSFYGQDGEPIESASWPYPYLHYKGFIRIQLIGDCLKQRNVFLYPPQSADVCKETPAVVGTGSCGVNGQEKTFMADQCASDCDGNLAGPYFQGAFVLDTFTTITAGFNDTVNLPAALGGGLIQNQLASLPVAGQRTRTAQGFNPATGEATSVSFYIETRVTEEEFYAALAEARVEYNILPEDECGWVDERTP